MLIEITNNIIDVDVINDLLKKYASAESENISVKEINIVARKEIIDVNYSFVGHLILIKSKFPKIKITLELPFNSSNNKDNEVEDIHNQSVIWKLKQFIAYTYQLTDIILFTLKDRSGNCSINLSSHNWFTLSKCFIPVLYIDCNSYKTCFNNKFDFLSINDIFNKASDKKETTFYQIIRRNLFKHHRSVNYIQLIAQLSFYRALKVTRILSFFIFDNYNTSTKKLFNVLDKEELKVGNISNKQKIAAYRPRLIEIFTELKFLPPVYHIIFSTLLSSEINFVFEDDSELKIVAKKIKNLWEFTKELIAGIQELAKNIVQHSTNQCGIISGYINEQKDFEINVFDHGIVGIIETLKNSTLIESSKTENPLLVELFKEDYLILGKKDFQLESLYKVNNSSLLNQQTKRGIAHLGLLYFNNLIIKNNGKLDVSSVTKNSTFCNYSSSSEFNARKTCLGTNYTIWLSTTTEYKPLKKNQYKQIKAVEEKINIQQLFEFHYSTLNKQCTVLQYSTNSKYIYNIDITKYALEDRELENAIWEEVMSYPIDQVTQEKFIIHDLVFAINLECISINESQLFRFCGKWEMFFPGINLIIYNFENDVFKRLLKINDSYSKMLSGEFSYWNENVITIFYSYTELKKDGTLHYFYFTDALWGKEKIEFFYINALIKKNNYNSIFQNQEYKFDKKHLAQLPDTCLFHFQSLLPFDVLIKSKTKETIFENNAKTILNNSLITRNKYVRRHSLFTETFFDNNHFLGYKITDTHYRLGSKIHISDFYFAKSFFQNSFFSSRYALIITKYILNQFSKEELSNLTIVGYGLYSELLVSNTSELLKNYLKKHHSDLNIQVSHNLINDAENLQFIKSYDNPNSNIILIIPIASTFNTSLKIEKRLTSYSPKIELSKFLTPHINIIEISNGNLELKSQISRKDIEWRYGWRTVLPTENIVKIEGYYEPESLITRDEKYFLALESKWHNKETCEICFPHSISNCANLNCSDCKNRQTKDCLLSEKPLYITDKTSVTPSLLFDYPKCKDISLTNYNKIDITLQSLKYAHTIRNNDHFHYYFYDETFFSDNRDHTEKWLNEKVKKDLNISPAETVLLFAPEHYSNTKFVNCVNEQVFQNSAIILHYDVWNNSIENFQSFYQEYVNRFDHIYFVDDTIITGSTLKKANEFIILTKKDFKGFEGCLTLINRMNKQTQSNTIDITLNKSHFYSFANIHLPTSKGNESECQLCFDYNKHLDLFNESFLDRFKHHFYQRILKLKKEEITSNENVQKQNQIKQSRFYFPQQNILKIDLIHRLFEYLNIEANLEIFENTDSFFKWQDHFLHHTKTILNNSLIDYRKESEFPLSNYSSALFKILALHPFNIYQPIKERIFVWTVSSLNFLIEKIKEQKYDINYGTFRDLKFLIRRVGLLNSNYLISERFFMFIVNLYRTNALKRIKTDAYQEYCVDIGDLGGKVIYDEIKNNVDEFPTYVIAQIKELLYKNESKCIVIEEQIIKANKLLINSDNNEIHQLLRMLYEENGLLIKRLFENYKNKLTKLEFSDIFYKDVKSIIDVEDDHIYIELEKFFQISNQKSPKENTLLKKYLQICAFLYKDLEKHDNNAGRLSVKEKTHLICDNLRELFFGVPPNNGQGLFLLVKYKEDDDNKLNNDKFPAYNKGIYAEDILDSWYKNKSYLTDFIQRKTNANNDLITLDLVIRKNDTWISQLSEPKEKIEISFLDETTIKYLLIIRLSAKEINKNNHCLETDSLGVMVFYSTIDLENDHLNIYNEMRYLLLLREGLSSFLKKHILNDEYRDWVENERIRLVYENRFDRYTHGARKYFSHWNRLFEQNDYTINHLRALSQIIYSQVEVGHLYADYCISKDKMVKDSPTLKVIENYQLEELKFILEGIITYFRKHIKYLEIDYKELDGLTSVVSYNILKMFLLELICNAIPLSGPKCIIKFRILNDYLEVSSVGQLVKNKNIITDIQEHINNEYPENPKYGIGLFIINKYCLFLIKKGITLKFDDSFTVGLPLK